MSEPNDKPECEPFNSAACMLRFRCISEKLNDMHGDIQKLSVKVSNGLTDRIHLLDAQVKDLNSDRDRRDKIGNRVQLIVVGLMIALSTASIMYGVKHFAQHQQTQPTAKP